MSAEREFDDATIDRIIDALDTVAREQDDDTYRLPVSDHDARTRMRQAVRDALRTEASDA